LYFSRPPARPPGWGRPAHAGRAACIRHAGRRAGGWRGGAWSGRPLTVTAVDVLRWPDDHRIAPARRARRPSMEDGGTGRLHRDNDHISRPRRLVAERDCDRGCAHCRRGAAAGACGPETVRTQAPHNTQGRVHRLSTSVPDLNRAIHNGARAACPQPWSTECSGHQSITQKSFQTTLETCLQDPQGTFVQFSPWLEIAGRLYRNNLTTATLPADSRRGRVYTATRISAPTPILYISP